MAEQHIKILQALGMPEDKIQEIERADPKDFKPDAYTGTLTEIQKNKLLNDEGFLSSIPEEKLPALIKKIEAAQYGRFMKESDEVAKELGVDTEGMPEETRRGLKSFQRENYKRYLQKHGGENKGAVTELQTKLQDALKNYDDLSKSQQAKIDELLAQEKGSAAQKMESLVAKVKVASINGLNDKSEYVMPVVHAKIKALHDVVFNTDSMEFELKQKGKPQLDVLKANGSKLTYDEELVRILTEDGKISEKVAEKEQRVGTYSVGKGGAEVTKVPDYIAKKMAAGLKEEVK